MPETRTIQTGLLGADYRIENGRYRLGRVYDGENWNPDLKAPLTQPGVNVREGEYLLEVNGKQVASADDVRSALGVAGYTSHILGRGHERIALDLPGYRARRYVVEASHSWMNRFRRLLVRWEKKVSNYVGLLHIACAVIVWRKCPLTSDHYLFG